MPKASFAHIDTWVFDLDNTLYPPAMRLFDQIEVRMTNYVMNSLGVDRPTADQLRQEYWARYGTTLTGLMREHNVDPGPYLHDVHEISLEHLSADLTLRSHIRNLPGQCIVYTNGTAPYAERVLAARGLSDLFDGVYGVENADFLPKPERAAFETVFAKANVEPTRAAMFEDDLRNLQVPHELGMRTVHVAPENTGANHVHHHTDDLTEFLGRLT